MKIQTNTAANSALGYMKVNAQSTERSIQKLSSGFRINRASDDAAGLAIANTLRADAKTLGQAQRNAAQASSMLQIADGASATIGNIFDRMRELASQGASANVGGQGQKLQDEWNALYSEVDRTIKGTSYQGINVLTGLTAGASVGGTAGTFSGSVVTAASVGSSANGTYQIKDGAAGILELWSTGVGAAKISQTSAAVASAATSASFANGVSITLAGFTGAVAGSSAVAGTAGTFSGGGVTGVSGIPTSLADGNYHFADEAGNTGKLEIRDSQGGLVAVSQNAVSSGAGTVSFTNGYSVTLDNTFTAFSAGSAANNGTATADATATTGGATAATSSSTSANGTYTISSAADGEVTLDDGAGHTETLSSIADGAQTLSFASLGIDITVDGTFTTADSGSSTPLSIDGGTITVAGAAPLVAGSASSADTATFVTTGHQALVNAAASNADASTFVVSGVTAAGAAPTILVGTSASQTSGTVAQRATAYSTADSISLDLGTLDDDDVKNLSSTINAGAGGLASGSDITTVAGAQDAMARLDKAEAKLNTFIGKLGAAESRVDYATQNVDSMLQNTQAAESSIRDADMAQEMTSFTKNNILQQAAQAMLSQANQGTQGILQLLRG